MKKHFNKKFVAIIAIMAVVAILSVCLVACNNGEDNNGLSKETFEKRMTDKGYTVVTMSEEQLKDAMGSTAISAEWGIIASIATNSTIEADIQYASIIKFANENDAKTVEAETLKIIDNGFEAVRNGSIVIVGTAKAVEDAKN